LINAVIFKLRFARAETWTWLGILLVSSFGFHLAAADLKQTQRQLQTGDYSNCIVSAEQALREHSD